MCADTGSEQTSVVVWETGGTSVKCSGCSWSLCRAPGCAYLLLRSTKREEPKTAWKATNPSPSLLLPTTPLLPSLHPRIYPSTRHLPLPWLPQARASVRRGWGEASGQAGRSAGQLQRSAVAWCAYVCGAVRRGPGSSESCGGGGRADRALLIERSWKPAVTGHWGWLKLPPELICLQCVCAIYRVLLSNVQAGEKIVTVKTTKILRPFWKLKPETNTVMYMLSLHIASMRTHCMWVTVVVSIQLKPMYYYSGDLLEAWFAGLKKNSWTFLLLIKIFLYFYDLCWYV